MLKLLHFADRHGRDKDIVEVERCDDFIVKTAIDEKPGLIVFSGDMFDSHEIKHDSLSARLAMSTISQLADIAPVAIITGTYKHDGKAPEILSFARGKFPVHVASYPPEQIFLFQGSFYPSMAGNLQPDAIITMIPSITKQFFKTTSGIADADQEIAQQMTGLFLGFGAACADYKAPHVLLWHGGISGAKIPSGHVLTGQDIEISTDQIRLAGNNHDFLGCFYPGPVYPVKVDEQECGFWVHELDERDFLCAMGHIHQPQQIGGAYCDGPVSSTYVPTPFTRTVRFIDDFTKDFMGTADIGDYQGKHVRYEITAWQDEAEKTNKDEIAAEFVRQGALSAEVRITRIPRENIRAASVLEALTLKDKLAKRAELMGETLDPEIGAMADFLEGTPAEQILAMESGGAV
ncbi:MAG: hypothetical protein WC750_06425 [Patescibacteria group bacterium]|jgi:hypothetical protein